MIDTAAVATAALTTDEREAAVTIANQQAVPVTMAMAVQQLDRSAIFQKGMDIFNPIKSKVFS